MKEDYTYCVECGKEFNAKRSDAKYCVKCAKKIKQIQTNMCKRKKTNIFMNTL